MTARTAGADPSSDGTGCGDDEMTLRECIEFVTAQRHSRELQSILNHLERRATLLSQNERLREALELAQQRLAALRAYVPAHMAVAYSMDNDAIAAALKAAGVTP